MLVDLEGRSRGYAGRYARRPPIAQHRFRTISRQEIRFVTKDTRMKRTVETTYTPAEFLATLADHVPDRYRHNVRYFGLLAPRVKCQTHDAVFALLGQERKTCCWENTGGCDGRRRCRNALASTRWWTGTAGGCAGLAACHPPTSPRRELTRRLRPSQTDSLPKRENASNGLRNPSASRDLTAPSPDTGLVPLTAHASRPLGRSPASMRLRTSPRLADDARLGSERTGIRVFELPIVQVGAGGVLARAPNSEGTPGRKGP